MKIFLNQFTKCNVTEQKINLNHKYFKADWCFKMCCSNSWKISKKLAVVRIVRIIELGQGI